jgi:hypothetical protein
VLTPAAFWRENTLLFFFTPHILSLDPLKSVTQPIGTDLSPLIALSEFLSRKIVKVQDGSNGIRQQHLSQQYAIIIPRLAAEHNNM